MLSESHPFLMREYSHGIIEIIAIDSEINASHKIIETLFLLSKKRKNVIFTIPPQCSLSKDSKEQILKLSKIINLTIVHLSELQIPFSHDFINTEQSSISAVLNITSSIVKEKIFASFSDVTPFKSSALNILNLLNNPDISFKHLEQQIIDEPLLVARVLQTANSVFFMRRSKVQNIGQALAYLGTEGIKSILLELIFHNLATKYFVEQKEKISHSLACSHLAATLAGRLSTDRTLLGKIRVAALLHDIGALAIQYSFPDEYKKAISLAQKDNIQSIKAESIVFGLDHTEIGSQLCQEWKLPEYLSATVANHHDFSSGQLSDIIEPVICANGFLNKEVENVTYFDYEIILKRYSKGSFNTNEEASNETKDFLKNEWEKYKKTIEQND